MTKNPYLKRMIETATPVQLVSMLLERAADKMNEADQALEANDLDRAHEALVEAQRVIAELITGLDVEAGGDVAQRLRGLYQFVWERLLQANLRKTAQPLREARELWRPLCDLWHDVEAAQA